MDVAPPYKLPTLLTLLTLLKLLTLLYGLRSKKAERIHW